MALPDKRSREDNNPDTDEHGHSPTQSSPVNRPNRLHDFYHSFIPANLPQNDGITLIGSPQVAHPVHGQATSADVATKTSPRNSQLSVHPGHSPDSLSSAWSQAASSPSKPPASPSMILSDDDREAHLGSLPPLSLNDTPPVIATEAPEPALVKEGKRKVAIQKYMAIALIFILNFMLIFSSWYWPKFYFIYLPLISLPLVLNCIMVFDVIVLSLKNSIFKQEKVRPEKPEDMVLFMPCYNETLEQCTKSLDSLVNQVHIGNHKRAIMVVCDGRVRGPGMEKTTADYLTEDVFTDQVEQRLIRSAYVAWDGNSMDIVITRGIYRGVPIFCIVKQQNQGKRDSLIVIRSFVHNFNLRHNQRKVIFKPELFKVMADFLVEDAGIDRVELLIGMDADTVFADDCVSHLVEESHYPGTVGVSGYVAVDFSTSKWNIWSIYQSAEYTIAQGLRRLHQSLCTKKVSCLPGCCQLLRVCEETCGDSILIQEFGYYPKPTDDIIKRIRATASEDRNHACLMLMKYPMARTRQALRAYAYTDVPRSLSVFLSQRRRWTLGATGNDLMLFLKSPITFNLWERIVAFSNVLTWILNFFVIASLACMVYAFMHQPLWITMAFASVMVIPLVFYLSMAAWMCRNRLERCQYLLGLCIFTICGPFINICVTLYACIFMDNFSWGKTRKVIAETDAAEEPNGQAEKERFEDALNGSGKVMGTMVPDEENQLHPEVYRTPFVAAPETAIESNSGLNNRSTDAIQFPAPAHSPLAETSLGH